ncbi:ABC transporter permease [Hyphomicrobium sp. DY-1]|uniref:ABC transporter permease n=1 Tax=Hyphomicrobium sp. DY-1 TaxID=3075650 RepID=UPI0039C3BB6C
MTVVDVKQNAAIAREEISVRRRRMNRSLTIHLVQFGILVAILAIWQFGVSDASLPYFSRPTIIGQRLIVLLSGTTIYRHIYVTLTEIVSGYVLGAALGLLLGFVLGRSPFLSAVLQPYIMALYSIPKIALAPVFIVWLGLGIASKIAVVLLSSFFLVFFNTYSGLLGVNEEFVRLARLMGASWTHTLWRVVLPAAAPQIFIGLKTAVPYAVIGAVIGEYIGANEGLGFFILYASQTYDVPSLFSGIILLVSIVFAVNVVLTRIERRIMQWRKVGPQALNI